MRDAFRAQELFAEDPTLDDQDVVVLGECLQGFGRGRWVAVGKGERRRTKQEIAQLVGHMSGGEPGQGHLDDLHLGTARLELATQHLLLFDRKPCVLGHKHGLRSVEALLDVNDGLDLLRSWHSSSSCGCFWSGDTKNGLPP